MAQVYTVTASTSLVLISTVQSPNTVVLLSSVNTTGHLVTIQDLTSSLLLQSQPIIVSTVAGVSFADGTSSFLINQPLGQATVSSRTANQWYLLNNKGFLSKLNNAYLDTLTVGYAYTDVLSSQKEVVSTMNTQNMLVTNTITFLGQAQLQGDFTVQGDMSVFSSLVIQDSLYLSSVLRVGGRVAFPSSLNVQDNAFFLANVSTTGNVAVADTLNVSSLVELAGGALLPKQLSVQSLRFQTADLAGGLQATGWFSTQSNALIGQELNVQQSTIVQHQLSTGQDVYTQAPAFLQGPTQANFVSIFQDATVTGSLFVGGNAKIEQEISTGGSFTTTGSILAPFGLVIDQGISAAKLEVNTLQLLQNATFSTLSVPSLSVGQAFLALGSSLTMSTILRLEQSTFVGKDLVVFSTATILDNISVANNLVVGTTLVNLSTLSVGGTLYVGQTLEAGSLTVYGGLSSFEMSTPTEVNVGGNLTANLLSTSFLGAPIDLSVSSIALSDTLRVSSLQGPNTILNKLVLSDNTAPSVWIQSTPYSTIYSLYVEGITKNNQEVDVANVAIVSSLTSSIQIYRSSQFHLGEFLFGNQTSSINVFLAAGGLGDQSTNTIFASPDFTTWNPYAITTAFPDFTYSLATDGNGLWVATSYYYSTIKYATQINQWLDASQPPTNTAWSYNPAPGPVQVVYGLSNANPIFYTFQSEDPFNPSQAVVWSSPDGSTWSPTTDAATFTLQIRTLFYESNTQVWLAGGDLRATGPAGESNIIYSTDGATWQNLTTNTAPGTLITLSFAFGNGVYVAAGNSDGTYSNAPFRYANSATPDVWQVGTWDLYYAPPTTTIASVVFGNGKFIANDGDTIYWSADGITWPVVPLATLPSGIVNRLLFQNGLFVAVGYFYGGLASMLYSPDGITWSSNSLSFGTNGGAYDIAAGPILSNIDTFIFNGQTYTSNIPMINMPAVFQSNLSANQIVAQYVTASSFAGNFQGDGSQLSNVVNIANTGQVSTATLQTIQAQTYWGAETVTSTIEIYGPITVSTSVFQSSQRFYLAGGRDIFKSGMIQESGNSSEWSRTLVSEFLWCYSVVGDGDPIDPFYVATGIADSSSKSIQWSEDGVTWNAATTGGFPATIPLGGGNFAFGAVVAYSPTLMRYVAMGWDNNASGKTIYYSDDGKNWSLGAGTLPLVGYYPETQSQGAGNLIWADSVFVAVGHNDLIISPGEIFYSFDGITWNYISNFGFVGDVEYGTTAFTGSNIVFTSPEGAKFTVFNQTFTNNNSFNASGLPGGYTFSLAYNNSYWLAYTKYGLRSMFSSVNALVWTQVDTTPLSFIPEATYNTLYWDTIGGQWLLGMQTAEQSNTIWRTPDLVNWSNATLGGFSSGILEVGAGYGFVLGGDGYVYAYGDGGATQGSYVIKMNQFNIPPTFESSLFLQNTAQSIRGMAFEGGEPYPWVLTGLASNPTRTLARSLTPFDSNTWQNAAAGGFSTIGHGALYSQFHGVYFAVGEGLPSNTIQYSSDGIAWFGANNAQGVRRTGYGIAKVTTGKLLPPPPEQQSTFLLALGSDTTSDSNRTIVYNYISTPGIVDPFTANTPVNWNTITSGGFNVSGRAAASGTDTAALQYVTVAVGDAGGTRAGSIKYSGDILNWSNTSLGGFNVRGLGVASDGGSNFVAVGEDTNSNYNIQYSTDGGQNFFPITGASLTKRANAVFFIQFGFTKIWLVTGEDINGDENKTIMVSYNQSNFNYLDYGFPPFYATGSANSFFSQPLTIRERNPFLESSNLTIYERSQPFYTAINANNTIRTQPDKMILNDTILWNSSSQMVVASNAPWSDKALVTAPILYASSILFQAPVDIGLNPFVSSLTVSTIHANLYTLSNVLSLPGLALANQGSIDTGAVIPSPVENAVLAVYNNLNINGISFSKQNVNIQGGFLASNVDFTLLNDYTTAASTVQTEAVYTQTTTALGETQSGSGPIFTSPYLDIYTSDQYPNPLSKNTIQVTPSTLAFNNTMFLNISSQRVGVFTADPQFDFHVNGQVIVSSISATTIKVGSFSFLAQFF